MTIRTRLIILGLCVAIFFIAGPYIVLYSLGYRVNFETWEINGTGGIYVYAQPEPESVLIDNLHAKNTGFFSSAVFVQNLMPGPHTVLVQKDGYHDYRKTLEVAEKEVTKLENVTLFKKDIVFSSVPLEIGETAKTQFAALAVQTTSPRISPDGRKRIYYDSGEIYYIAFEGALPPVLVRKSLAKISQVYWLNNDYLIFLEGDPSNPSGQVNIIISEIDTRGNINIVNLTTAIKPQLFFDQQDKKAYILTGKAVLVSERLVP